MKKKFNTIYHSVFMHVCNSFNNSTRNIARKNVNSSVSAKVINLVDYCVYDAVARSFYSSVDFTVHYLIKEKT